jgi:hypothetical protein
VPTDGAKDADPPAAGSPAADAGPNADASAEQAEPPAAEPPATAPPTADEPPEPEEGGLAALNRLLADTDDSPPADAGDAPAGDPDGTDEQFRPPGDGGPRG